jgi:hypothetical protein
MDNTLIAEQKSLKLIMAFSTWSFMCAGIFTIWVSATLDKLEFTTLLEVPTYYKKVMYLRLMYPLFDLPNLMYMYEMHYYNFRDNDDEN